MAIYKYRILPETSCHKNFRHSVYHQGLLNWHVFDDRLIPNPGKSPYYSQEFFNHIKSAIRKNLAIESMSSKEWYEFILSSLLKEPDQDSLLPCRTELMHPSNDWDKTWSLARLKGLSSESTTFLWLMLHRLLPTRDRLHRILPTVPNATCQECDEQDSLRHALTECRATRPVFDWMMNALAQFDSSLTADKMLLLNIEQDHILPYSHLPLVWFIAEVWRRVWKLRRDNKQCHLFRIRAEIESEINTVRRSRYSDMAVILDLMVQ